MKARGLGRVFKRGGALWIQYSYRGKKYRESVAHALKKPVRETMPTDATRLLKQRLSEGRPVGREAERVSFDNVLTMVLDDYAARHRKSEPPLARLREFFKRQERDPALEIITPRAVKRYIKWRLVAKASDATIRNEVSVLARGLTLLYEDLELPRRARLPMPGPPRNARAGFFTDAEMARLLPFLPEYMRAFVEAAYITGWRRGEIRSLTWSRVDNERGVIRLEPGTTKNDEGREFPFAAHPRLAALLAEQRERTSALEKASGRICPWVFHRNGHPVAWYYQSWHTACEKAEVPGRLVHDLRRSAVRNLVRAGVSERVAMTLTGHKTRSVFDRYHIVPGTDQFEAVRKLAALHDTPAPTEPAKVIALGDARRERRD